MSGMQSRLVRANLLGTGVFVVASGVAMPFKADRWAQVLVIVVSVALFAVGIFTSLQAYARALDHSRVHEIGVANLYLLTGRTAPPPVKRSMLLALGVGYFLFDEVPTMAMLAGAALVVAAGLVIVYRERRLGIERARARKVMTPQG